MPRFLDTNILLRYFTGEPPNQAAQARRLLQRVESGDEKVVISVMVLFETVFTLQRTYQVPKGDIRQMVGDIVALPGIQLEGKQVYLRALAIYTENPALSFADAYNVAFMEAHNLTELYSWDTDFDRLGSVTRFAPND